MCENVCIEIQEFVDNIVIEISQGGTSVHNSLQGLNDGDYIHLTANEKLKFDSIPNSFGAVATSNDYNDLDNLPTIPTNTSDLNNDSGFISTETDPIFQASEASLFVVGDKANLDNQSGVNTGDETTASIQTKRPLKTINLQSLEGNGNININSSTNLSYTPSPTNGTVVSDSGSDATIPLADNVNAGLLSSAEKLVIANALTIDDISQLKTIQFTYSASQTFTFPETISAIYGVFVSGQGTLNTSQYSYDTTSITILDPLSLTAINGVEPDFVNVIYANATVGVLPTYTQAEINNLFLKKNTSAGFERVWTFGADGIGVEKPVSDLVTKSTAFIDFFFNTGSIVQNSYIKHNGSDVINGFYVGKPTRITKLVFTLSFSKITDVGGVTIPVQIRTTLPNSDLSPEVEFTIFAELEAAFPPTVGDRYNRNIVIDGLDVDIPADRYLHMFIGSFTIGSANILGTQVQLKIEQ